MSVELTEDLPSVSLMSVPLETGSMKKRIEGIDYLRALMSIFVVVWHMHGVDRSLMFSETRYQEHSFSASDFVNFHLLFLAVPTFIFVSVYLYAIKPVTSGGLRKRIGRVFVLLAFWPPVLTIYNESYHGLVALILSFPSKFPFVVLQAGETIYYFFCSLIVCLLVSHAFMRLKIRSQIFVFTCSVAVLALLPEVTKRTGYYPLSAYWSPFNFVPVSLAAVIVAQNKDVFFRYRRNVLLLSLMLCSVLSVIEWKYAVGKVFFPGQGYAMPAYTRASLLFAVVAVSTIALDTRIRSGRVIKYMSEYSLALYCLHPFLINPLGKLVSKIVDGEAVGRLLAIALVILFSYFIAMILRRFFLKEELVV
jgi:peptidoglycan/LPS O-acetylase OafA/YrhL